MAAKVRPIALYLPQFHPVPENDEWWGPGFTEWTNVAKARPRYPGHYQPHIPADLGFYDLRLPETRAAQADLARRYGIHGFCYYHYWFNGRRILERPINEVLATGEPDMPFMLCWANENWTRSWDGTDHLVLLNQNYSEADDRAHVRSLLPYFEDDRYIKVDGRPVFVIYKDAHLPDAARTTETFRDEARRHGMELYLCRFDRDTGTRPETPETLGFDAAIEFQPLSKSMARYVTRNPYLALPKYLRPENYVRKLFAAGFKRPLDAYRSYRAFADFDLASPKAPYKAFPGVSPGWDNTARRKSGATIFYGSTPAVFQHWVSEKVRTFEPFGPEEDFLFVNAWNEWAEGNHLEPCRRWGHQYLEALRSGVQITTAGDHA
jgi:lipopolysaccharide biosynthesis protein